LSDVEPENVEPPADLDAHEAWLIKMRELGQRFLNVLVEKLENAKIPKD
jgi:hypothetical protein